MLITDLPTAQRAFWMDLIEELDAEPHAPVLCIGPQFDPEEEPDVDLLMALIAAQVAAAEA